MNNLFVQLKKSSPPHTCPRDQAQIINTAISQISHEGGEWILDSQNPGAEFVVSLRKLPGSWGLNDKSLQATSWLKKYSHPRLFQMLPLSQMWKTNDWLLFFYLKLFLFKFESSPCTMIQWFLNDCLPWPRVSTAPSQPERVAGKMCFSNGWGH